MVKNSTSKKSKFKGVIWSRRFNTWSVRIWFNGAYIYAGTNKDERKAALMYDMRAASLGLTHLNILKPKV